MSQKQQYRIQPFYNVAELGKFVNLYYGSQTTITWQGGSLGTFPLLYPDQLILNTITQELSGSAAGGVATFAHTFDRMVSLPAWLTSVRPLDIIRIVVGVGNTGTLTARIQVQIVNPDGTIFADNVYDDTVTLAGIAADGVFGIVHNGKATNQKFPYGSYLRVNVTAVFTRTAGAAVPSIFWETFNAPGSVGSTISVHILPDISNAETILGSNKIA